MSGMVALGLEVEETYVLGSPVVQDVVCMPRKAWGSLKHSPGNSTKKARATLNPRHVMPETSNPESAAKMWYIYNEGGEILQPLLIVSI